MGAVLAEKRPLIVDMCEIAVMAKGDFRAFLHVCSQIKKKGPQDSATPCFVRISNQLTTHAANNGETHKQRKGVARWLSLMGDSFVAPFWSEWQSQISNNVTPQQSE
jgi:hypothetical protein